MRPLAIGVLLLAVVALAIPFLVPLVLLLVVVLLRRAAEPRSRLAGRVALGLAAFSLVGWGGVLFLGRQQVEAHRGGAECEAGLQALLLAQEGFRAGRDRYATESELGFEPPTTSARYFQSSQGADAKQLNQLGIGRSGVCPDCRVVLGCERDGRWWTIASFDRTESGLTTPAGTPRQN